MTPDRIIFVYNTDSGLFNAVTAWSHKLFTPETYQCSLCRCTFGLTGMLVPWKNFLEMLPFPSVFLHRDEFHRDHPKFAATPLPLILVEKDGVWERLIDASEITEMSGLAGLIALVQARLEDRASAKTGRVRSATPFR